LQGEYIFITFSEILLLDYFSILAGVEIGFFSFEVNVQELRANCNRDIRVSKSNTQNQIPCKYSGITLNLF